MHCKEFQGVILDEYRGYQKHATYKLFMGFGAQICFLHKTRAHCYSLDEYPISGSWLCQ
jgi:hypothetical protein